MLNVLYYKAIDKLFGSGISTPGFTKNYELKKGDVVVDAGAYFGHFTTYAAKKVGSTGKVVAFEPNPKNYEILRDNVASLKLKNIVLVKKALFNKKDKLMFDCNFRFSSVAKEEKNNVDNIEVDCTTLDEELNKMGISKVDFIKMDIEGAELEAFTGMMKTLQNTSHLAIACYHKRNGKTTGEILQPLLNQMGFNTKIGFFLHPTLYGSKELANYK